MTRVFRASDYAPHASSSWTGQQRPSAVCSCFGAVFVPPGAISFSSPSVSGATRHRLQGSRHISGADSQQQTVTFYAPHHRY